MTSLSSPALARPRICVVCQVRPASSLSVFCSLCRFQACRHLSWRMVVSVGGRLLLTVLMEAMLGIFTGYLLLLPIGAASSMSRADVALMFILNILYMLPIFLTLYRRALRSWIVRADRWARANVLGALAPCCIMFVAVIAGLRLDTLPDAALLLAVVLAQAGVGMAVARWQQRLLVPSIQPATTWLRWSALAWGIASVVHLVVGAIWPAHGIGLWAGTAAGYLAYGVITHAILAHSAWERALMLRFAHYRTRFQ